MKMHQSIRSYNAPLMPTPKLVEQTRNLLHQLPQDHPRFSLVDRGTGKELDMDLPDEVFAILRNVLLAIAQNQAVSILPTNLELTTNQAADILNVSRGHILNLIKRKDLEYHMVGTHRRICLQDILAFKEKTQNQTKDALNKLAALDKELDLAE